MKGENKKRKIHVGEKDREKKWKRPVHSTPSIVWENKEAIVTLEKNHRAAFVGHGIVRVEEGQVDLYGHILVPSSKPLQMGADETLLIAWSTACFDTEIPYNAEKRSVVRISSVNESNGAVGDGASFTVSLWKEDEIHLVPDGWMQASDDIIASIDIGVRQGIDRPPIIAICGGKKVGKSSFGRYLVNKILNSYSTVFYLDTDCGQPEFTPPGIVSLNVLKSPVLGAPHMHQSSPLACHFIGNSSPSSDPERYIKCIRNLVETFIKYLNRKKSSRVSPLIVNMHGWVRGFGFQLLIDILNSLPLTHYVHIRCQNSNRDLPDGIFWQRNNFDTTLIKGFANNEESLPSWLQRDSKTVGIGSDRIEPLVFSVTPIVNHMKKDLLDDLVRKRNELSTLGENASMGPGSESNLTDHNSLNPLYSLSASDQRSLHWKTFAQSCIDSLGICKNGDFEDQIDPTTENGLSLGDKLAAALPYEVSLDNIEIEFLHGKPPENEVGIALNASIVGLSSKIKQRIDANSRATYRELSDGPPECLGLGIVRAFDGASRRLLVLTNLGIKELEKVNLIQVGSLEFPLTLSQTEKLISPYLTLHSLSSAGTASAAMRSRNNLLRARQI